MIQPELIQRTKENLQKLAEKMPEKFNTKTVFSETDFFSTRLGLPYIDIHIDPLDSKFTGLYVAQDPEQQYSNSIGRIIKEAFGEEMDIFKVWNSYKARFHPTGKFIPVSLESEEELSAQLEYMNLRIEQHFKGE